VDDILNAALFLLLGLELAVAPPNLRYAGLAAAAIVLVTAARWVAVSPWGLYLDLRRREIGATTVLAWGGVHGAISLALAFSLPGGPARPILLTITFAVVFASVLIQGLTFPRLARRLAPAAEPG
jgi:CPA1 family monovalent cation:H+ antiporter